MLRVGTEYYAKLQLMIDELEKSINDTLYPIVQREKPEYTADGWGENIQAALEALMSRWASPLFQAYARRLAQSFVNDTFRFAERYQRRTMGIEVFQNSQQLDDYLRAAVIQNVNLIVSIPHQHLERVGNIVFSGMRNGVMPSSIARQLQDEIGVTRRRAKFIARDQAAKVNGEIQKQRQIDAGFEYFKWVHVHDERVRHKHRELASARTPYGIGVYRWDDLPMGEDGVRVQPGSSYNCRCTARAIRRSVVEKWQKENN